MEFDHLRGFYYVAKLLSFTEAAGRLYVTQPAISLQVKALEKEVGERLFDRVGRTIKLTHAGQLLYEQVKGLISKLDEIQHTVVEIKSLGVGRLHLGASDTTSMYFLPGLLKAFLEAHARIDLRIVSLSSAQVIQKVLERDIDLGIVTICDPDPMLEATPLYRQGFVCIAKQGHALTDRKVVGVEDLAPEPMVVLDIQCLTRKIIDAYFQAHGVTPRPVLELGNFEIIKRYVASGIGVALVPEAAVQASHDGIVSIRLRDHLSVEVGAVCRKDRDLSQAARAFLALAADHFHPAGAARKVVGTAAS